MEPIIIPGPPREAFNKHRRMSDLIKAQIMHFKHIEEKLPLDVRRTLPQHHILSEDDAARYIASMTNLLLARRQPIAVPSPKDKSKPKVPLSIRRDTGLAIAAAAETKTNTKNPATKKSSSSKPKGTK